MRTVYEAGNPRYLLVGRELEVFGGFDNLNDAVRAADESKRREPLHGFRVIDTEAD